MDSILDQLALDRTFFYQLFIFSGLFYFLSRIYFKPFLELFESRHQKTVADREAAEKLMTQANAQLEEYKKRLTEERIKARREYESILNEAKKEEALILSQAREEAKKITQGTLESVQQQREQVRQQLEKEVDGLAKSVAESLLKRSD